VRLPLVETGVVLLLFELGRRREILQKCEVLEHQYLVLLVIFHERREQSQQGLDGHCQPSLRLHFFGVAADGALERDFCVHSDGLAENRRQVAGAKDVLMHFRGHGHRLSAPLIDAGAFF
jgi:hypothetical protein